RARRHGEEALGQSPEGRRAPREGARGTRHLVVARYGVAASATGSRRIVYGCSMCRTKTSPWSQYFSFIASSTFVFMSGATPPFRLERGAHGAALETDLAAGEAAPHHGLRGFGAEGAGRGRPEPHVERAVDHAEPHRRPVRLVAGIGRPEAHGALVRPCRRLP